jgi:hypothetical protein
MEGLHQIYKKINTNGRDRDTIITISNRCDTEKNFRRKFNYQDKRGASQGCYPPVSVIPLCSDTVIMITEQYRLPFSPGDRVMFGSFGDVLVDRIKSYTEIAEAVTTAFPFLIYVRHFITPPFELSIHMHISLALRLRFSCLVGDTRTLARKALSSFLFSISTAKNFPSLTMENSRGVHTTELSTAHLRDIVKVHSLKPLHAHSLQDMEKLLVFVSSDCCSP